MKPASEAENGGSTTCEVLVTPGARRDSISRAPDGTLRLKVSARPVNGKANLAVIAALGRALAIPDSRITIRHGRHGRRKLVEVAGLSRVELDARLAAMSQDPTPR